MPEIITPEIDYVILAGDHHGKYDKFKEQIEIGEISNALIIHLGDGNEGCPSFAKNTLEDLNEWLKPRNIHYWSIRGNHSDPSFFEGQWMLSNVKLLQDYTTATILGKKWLFVGGAISIDQIELLPGWNWWEGEKFRLDPTYTTPCDVLITHSGGSWVKPPTKSPLVAYYEDKELNLTGDSTLWEDLLEEAKLHDQLFNQVKPKQWFLGHFHEYSQVTANECCATIVGANELIEYRPTPNRP